MDRRRALIGGISAALLVPATSSTAQDGHDHTGHEGQMGGFVARDGSLHDHYDSAAPERARGEAPGGGGGGGGKGGAGGQGGAKPIAERKLKTTINGKTFSISADAEERLAQFIETYRTNGQVGNFVSALAAILAVWDLLTLDSAHPLSSTVDAVARITFFDGDEVAVQLSANNIWGRAWRAQAVSFCESEMATALQRNNTEEAKLWRHLRDVIANPQRYKDGGIRYDKEKNALRLRSPAGEHLRAVIAFDEPLSADDKVQFSEMLSRLIYFPSARDFLVYADFLLRDPKTSPVTPISLLDWYVLNKALLSLDKSTATEFRRSIDANANNSALNQNFWASIKAFTVSDFWSMGVAVPEDSVHNGFADDYPKQSDIVSGKYPPVQSYWVYPYWMVSPVAYSR